jgi:hypothetical protein
MNFKTLLGLMLCCILAVSTFAQGNRGKAELKAGAGVITIDYGRPELKGRDMLAQLKVGDPGWRMGSNQSTTFTTPVDLMFGATKIPKGAYSLFLKKTAANQFELVFNSQTGQWGLSHDVKRDFAQVPLKAAVLPNSVEVFTIDLKSAPKGGILVLSWGTTQLTGEFQFAQ